VFAVAVFVLVAYLTLARPDIQKPAQASVAESRSAPQLPDFLHSNEPEIEME
jgi:hypothetical protein